MQEELQRESQLSCGHWWAGMAGGHRWKCFPQYWWPKFRAPRQGISFIRCTYCTLYSHQSIVGGQLKSQDVIIRPELEECVMTQLIFSFYLFLCLWFPSRTHLSDWPTWVQHVTSTHSCKCGSTTWSCGGASISAIIQEHRNTTLSLVQLKTKYWGHLLMFVHSLF